MIGVDQWLEDTGVKAQMIMQVHDELVLEAANDEVAAVVSALTKIMSEAAELSVPLVVECGVGENWEVAH